MKTRDIFRVKAEHLIIHSSPLCQGDKCAKLLSLVRHSFQWKICLESNG